MAASNDEARPVLTGVLLHVIDGDLFVVATDSYRLAEKKLIKYKNDTNLLVPVTAMQELLRIISEDIEEVNVSYDEQQVLFVAGQVELVSRLIDGKYPQYKKLIPTSFQTSAILQKEELSSVTKVSSLFAKESAGSVQIKVNESNQELSIHSIASQVGENTSTASAEVKGEGSITLNSRYILDALHALKGQRVEFAFNGKLDPCLLRDPDDDSYIHIIMPLKS